MKTYKKLIVFAMVCIAGLSLIGCSSHTVSHNETLVRAYFSYLSTDPQAILDNGYLQTPLTLTIDNKAMTFDQQGQTQLIEYYTQLHIEVIKLEVEETGEDRVTATVVMQDELTKILNIGTYTASMEFVLDEGKIVSITQVTDSAYLSAYKINFAASIGIDYTIQEDGTLLITKVLSASPAKEAELKVDDIIVKIDGTECAQMNKALDEYYYRLRGLASSSVNLEIRRGTETTTVDITRERLTRNK